MTSSFGRLLTSLTVVACVLGGCSNGNMRIQERYYLIAENADNAVLYRITIRGSSKLAEAKYSSGWYPENAVDSVFGAVTNNSEISANATRKAMEGKISQGLTSLHAKYIDALDNGTASHEDLMAMQERLFRMRLLPDPGRAAPETTRLIEYDPTSSIVTFRHGTKQVLFLSADPDQVIGAIKNFASANETATAIEELTNAVSAQNNQARVTVILNRDLERAFEAELSQLVANARQTLNGNDQGEVSREDATRALILIQTALGDKP